MAKKPIGRPSEFSEKVASIICERIADGESLRTICLDAAMPHRSTVFRWLATNESFRDQYTRAREAQADALFEEILEIADDTSRDTIVKEGKDGAEYEAANSEWINRSRLRVDARKWMASKLAPKKYGDKLDVNHGGQPDNPIVTIRDLTGRKDQDEAQ
jgi:hypothetical protein